MITASVFAKMHTADPGAAGATAPATNATRKQLVLLDELEHVPASASFRLVQGASITYSTGEVTATETYAWVSLWDAVAAGNYLGVNVDIPNQSATLSTALTIPAGTIVIADRALIDRVLRAAIGADLVNNRAARYRRGSFRANTAEIQQARFAKFPAQQI